LPDASAAATIQPFEQRQRQDDHELGCAEQHLKKGRTEVQSLLQAEIEMRNLLEIARQARKEAEDKLSADKWYYTRKQHAVNMSTATKQREDDRLQLEGAIGTDTLGPHTCRDRALREQPLNQPFVWHGNWVKLDDPHEKEEYYCFNSSSGLGPTLQLIERKVAEEYKAYLQARPLHINSLSTKNSDTIRHLHALAVEARHRFGNGVTEFHKAKPNLNATNA
jgi:hypothetical protein